MISRKTLVVAIGLALLAVSSAAYLSSDTSDDCARAIAQARILRESARVYKLGPGDSRQYLADADRPAELARLDALVTDLCSKDADERRAQDEEADRLVIATGLECTIERDRLAMMEQPTARTPQEDIDRKRAFIAEHCPDVPPEDFWLPDHRVHVEQHRGEPPLPPEPKKPPAPASLTPHGATPNE
jgi:hypothetical protein